MNSFKPPTYSTKFTIDAQGKFLHANAVIDGLFEHLVKSDSVTFGKKLNLNHDQISEIGSLENDIVEGDFIEIYMEVKNTEVIIPLYFSILQYLKNDSSLNKSVFFTRRKLQDEIDLIRNKIEHIDQNNADTKKMSWQMNPGLSEPTAILSNSPLLTKVFLQSRLNSLHIKSHELEIVQELISPLIPKKPDKISVLTYFVISNILVICFLFLLILIRTNQVESHV